MTDQQPTYRRATLADLGRISEIGQLLNALHHSAWPEIFAPASSPQRDEAHWRQSLETESAAAFLAERTNEVLGFITLNVLDVQHALLQPVRYARINSVCVVEAARGQGIGRGLIRRAEQWAHGQGATDSCIGGWLKPTALRARSRACAVKLPPLPGVAQSLWSNNDGEHVLEAREYTRHALSLRASAPKNSPRSTACGSAGSSFLTCLRINSTCTKADSAVSGHRPVHSERLQPMQPDT